MMLFAFKRNFNLWKITESMSDKMIVKSICRIFSNRVSATIVFFVIIRVITHLLIQLINFVNLNLLFNARKCRNVVNEYLNIDNVFFYFIIFFLFFEFFVYISFYYREFFLTSRHDNLKFVSIKKKSKFVIVQIFIKIDNFFREFSIYFKFNDLQKFEFACNVLIHLFIWEIYFINNIFFNIVIVNWTDLKNKHYLTKFVENKHKCEKIIESRFNNEIIHC